jgi:hypothetical protein
MPRSAIVRRPRDEIRDQGRRPCSEVTSPRTGTVYSHEIPPGSSPAAYSLRCAERCQSQRVPGGHPGYRAAASADEALQAAGCVGTKGDPRGLGARADPLIGAAAGHLAVQHGAQRRVIRGRLAAYPARLSPGRRSAPNGRRVTTGEGTRNRAKSPGGTRAGSDSIGRPGPGPGAVLLAGSAALRGAGRWPVDSAGCSSRAAATDLDAMPEGRLPPPAGRANTGDRVIASRGAACLGDVWPVRCMLPGTTG